MSGPSKLRASEWREAMKEKANAETRRTLRNAEKRKARRRFTTEGTKATERTEAKRREAKRSEEKRREEKRREEKK